MSFHTTSYNFHAISCFQMLSAHDLSVSTQLEQLVKVATHQHVEVHHEDLLATRNHLK